MDALSTANTIYQELENCMFDLANGDEILADENWNDESLLRDMIGDRIFDFCNCFSNDDNKIKAWEVTDYLIQKTKYHPAFQNAVLDFKKRYEFI